ncbi:MULTISPECIES: alpha/beta hydrolase [Alphaproteobacteria]|uniref:Lysophospholipase n=2 Tax=Alphaproteobacteria TaxID=28211 RepID=A0A512HEF4_9HYPH|nr:MULTISPECIES: alpha/beta hydrolase [Alphaproteobacteria]GEO83822.1 lysophospholipase [Ciceribacter naphthalenivorans]GLR21300.1 lysophospholipase [Ciceribacter naphthalenivorans]GLT04156.1 lysophospholipase [Sphingomonas psychrolutea]
MAFETSRRLVAVTGAELSYHHEVASGRARGIVVVCHGLAEHSRRYRRFAEALSSPGYHVFAHDHRGHGETTAVDAPIGRFARREGWKVVIADTLAMRDFAAEQYPGLPVILFGHSMGGLIALNTATDHPRAFDGLAVWNSNFHPGPAGRFAQGVLALERMLKGSDVPSLILPRATFLAWGRQIPNRRTDADWLSHDPAEVDAYVNDPLCGFDASVSLWSDVFTLTFRGATPEQLDRLPRNMPIHLVGGAEDPATEKARAMQWLGRRLAKAGFAAVTTRIYPGMRHETLNETGRNEATQDFIHWCDAVSARPTATGSQAVGDAETE